MLKYVKTCCIWDNAEKVELFCLEEEEENLEGLIVIVVITNIANPMLSASHRLLYEILTTSRIIFNLYDPHKR